MYAKCLSLEPYNVVYYVLQATTLDSIGACVQVCVRACKCACVRACKCACVRASVRACASLQFHSSAMPQAT